MARLAVEVVCMEQQTICGIWKKSNDKTVSKDITTLSEKYYDAVALPKGTVFPYFVLSRNYDERSKDFEMLIGSTINKESLEKFTLPAGEYAKITVAPKLGLLWGISVGEAKNYFYRKWLPESPYEAFNMEYEYHTEKSIQSHPTIAILFAVQKRE